MKTWQILLLVYLGIMTAAGFISMFADKQKAKQKKWRTPEATLFLIALLGGALGSTLGMYLFRHKTKHWYFALFMPLIMIAQIVGVVLLFVYL